MGVMADAVPEAVLREAEIVDSNCPRTMPPLPAWITDFQVCCPDVHV